MPEERGFFTILKNVNKGVDSSATFPFKTRFTSVSQQSAKNLCSTNGEKALFGSISVKIISS